MDTPTLIGEFNSNMPCLPCHHNRPNKAGVTKSLSKVTKYRDQLKPVETGIALLVD